MRSLSSLFSLVRHQPLLLCGGGAGLLLAVAYGFQLAGYAPCELCWWQRYPYFALVGVAVAATLAGPRATLTALVLSILLLAVEFAIAAFHVGVEQHWWPGLASCRPPVDIAALSVEELLAYMAQEQPPRCDEAAWAAFGLSMAAWNGLAALGLLAVSGLAVGYKTGYKDRDRKAYDDDSRTGTN